MYNVSLVLFAVGLHAAVRCLLEWKTTDNARWLRLLLPTGVIALGGLIGVLVNTGVGNLLE